jgi:hypothetical protein
VRRSEIGQGAAEFALAAPILILLLFGLTLAAFYAFRAVAADWGVFVTGVAEGAYEVPASGWARDTVTWPDIAGAIGTASLGDEERQVSSRIDFHSIRSWVYGLKLDEMHRGMAFFRLWRFYAGPAEGDFE